MDYTEKENCKTCRRHLNGACPDKLPGPAADVLPYECLSTGKWAAFDPVALSADVFEMVRHWRNRFFEEQSLREGADRKIMSIKRTIG